MKQYWVTSFTDHDLVVMVIFALKMFEKPMKAGMKGKN